MLFVDDDPKLRGRVVAGIAVTTPAELLGLVDRYGISRILLALPVHV